MRLACTLLFFTLISGAAHADIFIGVAGPLSGQNASYGNELRTGAAAAIAAINAQGGINGENMALIEGDDACDSKRAVDVAKDFASRDVRFVVGHFCSSASMAAAPAYATAGIIMMTPSANLTEITTKSLWNVFRLTGRDDAQGEIAATRIKALGQAAEALLLTDQQADTAGIAKNFHNALPNSKSINVKAGSAKLPDDAALLTATSAYLALQPADAAALAADLRKINPVIALYGPDLLQSETYGTRAGDAANGTRITFLQDWSPIADPKRLTTLAVTDGAALSAYAAVESFVAAAKARNVNDARAMASWLTAGNEVQTIVGKLRFNASGDLLQQPYVWYQWRAGSLVPDPDSP